MWLERQVHTLSTTVKENITSIRLCIFKIKASCFVPVRILVIVISLQFKVMLEVKNMFKINAKNHHHSYCDRGTMR
jgi:hypothetical protein